MKTIYKYVLELTDKQTLSLPADSAILSIQMKGGEICAWIAVDTDMPEKDRDIFIAETGNAFDYQSVQYIDTVQDGEFVWHFFEW